MPSRKGGRCTSGTTLCAVVRSAGGSVIRQEPQQGHAAEPSSSTSRKWRSKATWKRRSGACCQCHRRSLRLALLGARRRVWFMRTGSRTSWQGRGGSIPTPRAPRASPNIGGLVAMERTLHQAAGGGVEIMNLQYENYTDGPEEGQHLRRAEHCGVVLLVEDASSTQLDVVGGRGTLSWSRRGKLMQASSSMDLALKHTLPTASGRMQGCRREVAGGQKTPASRSPCRKCGRDVHPKIRVDAAPVSGVAPREWCPAVE